MFHNTHPLTMFARPVAGLALGNAATWFAVERSPGRDGFTVALFAFAVVLLCFSTWVEEREAGRLALELFKANRSVRVAYVTEEDATRLRLPTPSSGPCRKEG